MRSCEGGGWTRHLASVDIWIADDRWFPPHSRLFDIWDLHWRLVSILLVGIAPTMRTSLYQIKNPDQSRLHWPDWIPDLKKRWRSIQLKLPDSFVCRFPPTQSTKFRSSTTLTILIKLAFWATRCGIWLHRKRRSSFHCARSFWCTSIRSLTKLGMWGWLSSLSKSNGWSGIHLSSQILMDEPFPISMPEATFFESISNAKDTTPYYARNQTAIQKVCAHCWQSGSFELCLH